MDYAPRDIVKNSDNFWITNGMHQYLIAKSKS